MLAFDATAFSVAAFSVLSFAFGDGEPTQPPVSGHGYGFLPERRKRRDKDDDFLMAILL